MFAKPRQPPRQTKVGIIHIQNALLATKDGQKAAQDLQNKCAPDQGARKKQSEINQVKDKLNKGSHTMSQRSPAG